MMLALVLIIAAILLGLGGFLIEGLKWLLILAVVLLVAGLIFGVIDRSRARR